MNILSDLSFARRTLAKHPLVTIAVAVVKLLALGIGANTTTVFSVVRAIFCGLVRFPRPEAYRNPFF